MSWKPIANLARWPLALCCFLPAYAQSTHWLQVSRLGGAKITESEADAILHEATMLLRMRDTPNDVAALVSLCREKRHSVNVTPGCEDVAYPADSKAGGQSPEHHDPIMDVDGPDVIWTEGDLNDAMKKEGYIKVVKEIFWCNGPPKKGTGHIAGCSRSKPQSVVVAREPARPDRLKLEAALWAHEYCHSKGVPPKVMPHRAETSALMRENVKAENRVINADECRAILEPHKTGSSNAHSRSRPCACVSRYPTTPRPGRSSGASAVTSERR